MALSKEMAGATPHEEEVMHEVSYEYWNSWPVNWGAVISGALVAVSIALLLGLIAVAVGAHVLGPDSRVVDLRKLEFFGVALAVLSSFFAFVIGAWAAGKIAGILHAEPAILTGVLSWLVAVPLIATLAAIGVGNDGWYGGVARPSGTVAVAQPVVLPPNVSEADRTRNAAEWIRYERQVAVWREESPRAVRNAALCSVTALLLGLMGSVVGGWLASGEEMRPGYRRLRSRGVVRAQAL